MKENYLKEELYALIKSDSALFEFIQSGSLDGIWYWDLEKPENEWMSNKFWETLGYDPKIKKPLASEWQDIIYQEDLERALVNFDKHCADSSYPYDQIVRYKHASGRTIWIRCRGLAIRDTSGKAIRMLGAHTDITELKEAENEITRLTDEYERVFNGTQDAMFLIKVIDTGKFRYMRNNLAHQTKTSLSLDVLVNKTPQELLGTDVGNRIAQNYQNCVDAGKSITYEEQLNLPAGERIWLTTLTPIFDGNSINYIVGSATDITERKKLEVELDRSANYDKLTGLPNRRLFFERLERLIVESERDRTSFALVFIDLDGFKFINDTYGHEVGDKVLFTVGDRLLTNLRKSDTVARMGGDEFTLLLRHIDEKQNIQTTVQKIHETLKDVMRIDSKDYRINASIGISIYPDQGTTSEILLKHADSAMYTIKKSSKGGIRFYSE